MVASKVVLPTSSRSTTTPRRDPAPPGWSVTLTDALARISARRPWVTIGLWVVAVVVALGLSGSLRESAPTTELRLSSSFESEDTATLLKERFPSTQQVQEVVIVQSDSLTVDDPAFPEKVDEVFATISGLARTSWPAERRAMVSKQIFPLSRALIGNEMADALRFPRSRTPMVLFQFKMLQRWQRLKAKLRRRAVSADNFGPLLAISAYDDGGISYRIPDHEHSERSSNW